MPWSTRREATGEVFPEPETSHDLPPSKVREVKRADDRYIVRLNPEEARKDRHQREAIFAGAPSRTCVRRQGTRSILEPSAGAKP